MGENEPIIERRKFMNMSFDKLILIFGLVSQAGLITGVGADKMTLALAVLQLIQGGEFNFEKIATFIEKNGSMAGEDAQKVALAVQILKILQEDDAKAV
jgi:hypothetical protein